MELLSKKILNIEHRTFSFRSKNPGVLKVPKSKYHKIKRAIRQHVLKKIMNGIIVHISMGGKEEQSN